MTAAITSRLYVYIVLVDHMWMCNIILVRDWLGLELLTILYFLFPLCICT